ncbi:MAG: hypothetical protein P4K83_05625 [Terracidiphilus sp.]|jgi:hypothetical protein|nr:hypothetical protein [Terracidiphilus sp.]
MKTVLRILERAGGYRPALYLKIENPPYMALVIEAAPEPGPLHASVLSVTHYGEQNGDLMRDPEMCFELTNPLGMGWTMTPHYFRNDYIGVEQYSRSNDGKNYLVHPGLFRQHESFARVWDRNLRTQGFLDAFERSR